MKTQITLKQLRQITQKKRIKVSQSCHQVKRNPLKQSFLNISVTSAIYERKTTARIPHFRFRKPLIQIKGQTEFLKKGQGVEFSRPTVCCLAHSPKKLQFPSKKLHKPAKKHLSDHHPCFRIKCENCKPPIYSPNSLNISFQQYLQSKHQNFLQNLEQTYFLDTQKQPTHDRIKEKVIYMIQTSKNLGQNQLEEKVSQEVQNHKKKKDYLKWAIQLFRLFKKYRQMLKKERINKQKTKKGNKQKVQYNLVEEELKQKHRSMEIPPPEKSQRKKPRSFEKNTSFRLKKQKSYNIYHQSTKQLEKKRRGDPQVLIKKKQASDSYAMPPLMQDTKQLSQDQQKNIKKKKERIKAKKHHLNQKNQQSFSNEHENSHNKIESKQQIQVEKRRRKKNYRKEAKRITLKNNHSEKNGLSQSILTSEYHSIRSSNFSEHSVNTVQKTKKAAIRRGKILGQCMEYLLQGENAGEEQTIKLRKQINRNIHFIRRIQNYLTQNDMGNSILHSQDSELTQRRKVTNLTQFGKKKKKKIQRGIEKYIDYSTKWKKISHWRDFQNEYFGASVFKPCLNINDELKFYELSESEFPQPLDYSEQSEREEKQEGGRAVGRLPYYVSQKQRKPSEYYFYKNMFLGKLREISTQSILLQKDLQSTSLLQCLEYSNKKEVKNHVTDKNRKSLEKEKRKHYYSNYKITDMPR